MSSGRCRSALWCILPLICLCSSIIVAVFINTAVGMLLFLPFLMLSYHSLTATNSFFKSAGLKNATIPDTPDIHQSMLSLEVLVTEREQSCLTVGEEQEETPRMSDMGTQTNENEQTWLDDDSKQVSQPNSRLETINDEPTFDHLNSVVTFVLSSLPTYEEIIEQDRKQILSRDSDR